LKVPERVGKQPVGPSARGSRTQGSAISSLRDSKADASLHAGKKMDFELLRSWKELEQIKGEVGRVFVCVYKGLKVFGLGPKDHSFFGSQKSASGHKHKKGCNLWAGPGKSRYGNPTLRGVPFWA
jgi:hypothetical protein